MVLYIKKRDVTITGLTNYKVSEECLRAHVGINGNLGHVYTAFCEL